MLLLGSPTEVYDAVSPALQKHIDRYANRFVAFRTILRLSKKYFLRISYLEKIDQVQAKQNTVYFIYLYADDQKLLKHMFDFIKNYSLRHHK